MLTWVPGEPRRAVPHDAIEAIIDLVEARYLHDLFAVQMVFLILVLYMALFFEWEHFAAGGAHTGGGVRQIHRGTHLRTNSRDSAHRVGLDRLGLRSVAVETIRTGASLAQNSLPRSSVRPFPPHRAPAAPSPEPMLDESAKTLAAELARRDACAGRMGC